MKKLMSVLVAVSLAMFLGCGGGGGGTDSVGGTGSGSTSPLAGTWDMATQNGTAISGFTATMVVNNDGSFSYTSTGAAKSPTGVQCAGSGTSSTSGSSLTRTYTANTCPDTGKTVPYNETPTYSISGSTLTFTNGDGSIETWTKQGGSTTPTAPGNVFATAGNGQTSVFWNAVSGATSYNIYWSTTSGVTKSNGTKITGATSPYAHTGTTNGTKYYYIVTAVNSSGESVASAEVSATPSATTVTHTASGTYTWNSGTGTLVLTWTSTDFACNEVSLGTETMTGVTITPTTMTWPSSGDLTWTRTSGTANDVLGTWTGFGGAFTITFNANGTVSITGVVPSSCG